MTQTLLFLIGLIGLGLLICFIIYKLSNHIVKELNCDFDDEIELEKQKSKNTFKDL